LLAVPNCWAPEVSNNAVQSVHLVTSSVQDAGYEPGKAGGIHLHTTVKPMNIQVDHSTVSLVFTVGGVAPHPVITPNIQESSEVVRQKMK